MITPEAYLDKLKEIEYLKYVEKDVDPDEEPVFEVDLNTRKITVPKDFQDLAVEGDHCAETVWFSLDRWFDGIDLTKKKFGVQYSGESGTGLIPITTYTTTGDASNTILLGWLITHDVTSSPGQLTFSLRVFSLNDEDDSIEYSLNTNAVTCTIKKALNINSESSGINPPPDVLSTLVDRIEELYENNSLTALSYNDINTKTLPTFNDTVWKGKLYTNIKKAQDAGTERVKIPYPDLTDFPTINGVSIVGQLNSKDLNISIDVDKELLETSTNPVENKAVTSKIKSIDEEVKKLWEEMDGMTFVPLSISSFTNNIGLAEKGSTVTEVTFKWTIGGTPKNITINDKVVDNAALAASTATLTFAAFKDNKTFTLMAEDKKNNQVSATTDIDFVYRVFSGVAEAPASYTESFVKNFTNKLQKTKEAELNVIAGENQYIYYCVPSEYGDCTFTAGGFTGGFKKVDTISITNEFKVSANYDIWKSDYANLGQTNIIIS